MQRRLISLSVGLISLAILAAAAPIASAAGPGLHGRVLGLDEEGRYVGVVAGASIEFKGQGGGSAALTKSGANGYYRVDLPAGVYTYKITAEGYRTEDAGRGLEIQQSEGYVVQDFSLVRGESETAEQPPQPQPTPVGRLNGRVFEINERGERIGGISRARLALRHEGATGLRRVVARGGDPKRDDAGQYAMELPVGQWRASVSADGYETLVFPELIPITEGETTTRDFELRRSAPLAPTLQGIKGLVLLPAETPRPVIRVRIESLLRPLATTPSLTPDAAGRFMRDLPAGNYRVLADAAGFHPAIRAPVTVFEGRYTTVVLRLTPLVKPEGPVEPQPTPKPFDLAVNVQERAPDGLVPIAGARVLLRRDGDALSQAARKDTDAKGACSFQVNDAGNFAVLAQAKGFKPGGLKLHIGPDQPNRADVILLRATPDVQEQLVTVNGSVVFRDPQNPKQLRALPRTRLVWRDTQHAQPVQQTDSDAQGGFSVQIPAGSYVVELQPPTGFRGDKADMAVTAKMPGRTFILEPLTGPDVTPPVEPPRDVQVAGMVVGSPLLRTGQFVSVPDASLSWKGPHVEKSTRTDRAGRFSLTLPPGLYNVRVAANGYDTLADVIVVQPGMDNVRLVLTRMAGPGPGPTELISLNVRVMQRMAVSVPLRRPQGLPTGNSPLANAEISILQKGQRVATGQSDRAGRYTVQLKLGQYDIKVTRDGFVPGQAEVALTTMPESREIILSHAAGPVDQPPPQRKHTLTVRVVEQSEGRQQGRSKQLRQPSVTPIAGAAIVIRQGDNVVANGTADRTGVYRVQLDSGKFDIKVSAQGFVPVQQAIAIGDADVIRQVVLTRTAAPR